MFPGEIQMWLTAADHDDGSPSRDLRLPNSGQLHKNNFALVHV